MSNTNSTLNNLKETLKANRKVIQQKAIVFGGATLGLLITSAITTHFGHRDTIIIVPVDAAGQPVAPSQAVHTEG